MPETFFEKRFRQNKNCARSNPTFRKRNKDFEMRRIFKIPVLILLLNLAAFSQNQSIIADKTDDYYKIIEAAFDKLKAVPYREVFQQVIEFGDGFGTVTETTTTEFVSPDRIRRIKTTVYTYSNKYKITDTIGFPTDKRKETITIGNVEFVKDGNKPWEKIEKKQSAEETKETKERDYIINFLGRKNINGTAFDIYEMIKIKDASQPKQRFWLNVNNGLLSKIDFDLLRTEDSTNKTEITYAPDTSIKIEAPKLN